VSYEARSWWGQAWSQGLDGLGPSSARAIQRGGALARRGAVDHLRVRAGCVAAQVSEDRVSPYRVELRWPAPGSETWAVATEAIASELRFTAALLEGELAPGIDEVLADTGVGLLPSHDQLEPSCTCPDRARWCRHAVAVHVAVGAQFDRDPALLLRFRGRELDALLRAVRAGSGTETAPLTGSAIDLREGLEAPRGDLDAIPLHPAPVADPAALFRHLGDPPGVDDSGPLVAIIERAAAGAWRLAAGDGAAAADEELLLAELRAQRMATPQQLADALGRDVDGVRDELDRLYADGTVLRTGSGDRARYRATPS
jgi:uncharacterized Zn finger protein